MSEIEYMRLKKLVLEWKVDDLKWKLEFMKFRWELKSKWEI